MSASIQWTNVETVSMNIRTYGEKAKQVAPKLLEAFAPKIETDAKNDAPWTDRTANARQSLFTHVYQDSGGNSTVLVLSHGMEYGVFLETRWQGRYATILPTLQRYYPQIEKALKDALK